MDIRDNHKNVKDLDFVLLLSSKQQVLIKNISQLSCCNIQQTLIQSYFPSKLVKLSENVPYKTAKIGVVYMCSFYFASSAKWQYPGDVMCAFLNK